VLFEKAVLGKPYTLEKNFLHMKYSADRLVLMNETKKISTLFRWVYWVKTGVDLLFFTLQVHCAHSKHCKIFKLTEYVPRPIFKHAVKFQIITVYLTPQPRRDFLLSD